MQVFVELSMVVAAFLGAVAQVLFKRAAPHLGLSVSSLWNIALVSGIVLYVLAFVINMVAYRGAGVQASRLYPFIALSYVFLVFLAHLFLGEQVTWMKVLGASIIVVGVGVISWQ